MADVLLPEIRLKRGVRKSTVGHTRRSLSENLPIDHHADNQIGGLKNGQGHERGADCPMRRTTVRV